MPKASKRGNRAQTALDRRRASAKISSCSDSSGEEYMMDVDDKELLLPENLLVTVTKGICSFAHSLKLR
jgi:hypothetical protein